MRIPPRPSASNLEQAANLMCAQANSASYPQRDGKWVAVHGLWNESPVWVVVCLCAAPWVQLFAIVGNRWPHNVPRYHQLMPISCQFPDCKALLFESRKQRYNNYPDKYLVYIDVGSHEWIKQKLSRAPVHFELKTNLCNCTMDRKGVWATFVRAHKVRQHAYTGWLHFLDESVAEPFGLVQTLIWTLHFGLSPNRRLAQAQPNCY